MPACQAIPSPEAFAPGMLAFLDCQAQTIGAIGYQALAAPGSPASILLTGMVTLVIAVFGYRLLLGYVPTIRDGVLTFVKIGVVLTLATSWPAYQIIAYDLILRSPAELASAVGGASGLPGTTGGLAGRLDGVDQAMKTLAIRGVGAPPTGPDGNAIMPSVAPSPFLGFDTFALGWSRVMFLVGTLASFAVVRIVAGLLLALGPLFAAFLLFDGTRGLFEGWLKGLLASALAALAISIVLGVELSFMEPWLATLLARRASELDIIGAPAQLLAATTIFAITLLAVVLVIARVAMSLRIPGWSLHGALGREQARPNSSSVSNLVTSSAPGESRSRAAAIVDAVATTQRREEALASSGSGSSGSGSRTVAAAGRGSSQADAYGSAAAGTSRRRTTSRVSARATARDRRR